MISFTFSDEVGRRIADYGSEKLTLVELLQTEAPLRAVLYYIAPGGNLGKHRVVGPQALLTIAGEANVADEDGIITEMAVGFGVFLDRGEEHEIKSASGATVLVLEGDDLVSRLWGPGPARG